MNLAEYLKKNKDTEEFIVRDINNEELELYFFQDELDEKSFKDDFPIFCRYLLELKYKLMVERVEDGIIISDVMRVFKNEKTPEEIMESVNVGLEENETLKYLNLIKRG